MKKLKMGGLNPCIPLKIQVVARHGVPLRKGVGRMPTQQLAWRHALAWVAGIILGSILTGLIGWERFEIAQNARTVLQNATRPFTPDERM